MHQIISNGHLANMYKFTCISSLSVHLQTLAAMNLRASKAFPKSEKKNEK